MPPSSEERTTVTLKVSVPKPGWVAAEKLRQEADKLGRVEMLRVGEPLPPRG